MKTEEARRLARERWKALPREERTWKHAEAFAAAFAEEIDIRTRDNKIHAVLMWLAPWIAGEW